MPEDPLGGAITLPDGIKSVESGFPILADNLITLAIGIGGLAVLFNIIMAAYDFLTASGDPKKITNAWTKIWQSLVGLLLLISAVALVKVIGDVFNLEILNPTIVGPGDTTQPPPNLCAPGETTPGCQ